MLENMEMTRFSMMRRRTISERTAKPYISITKKQDPYRGVSVMPTSIDDQEDQGKVNKYIYRN